MRFNALITGGAMALSVSLSTTASAADNAITMSSTAAPRTTISVVDLNLDSPSGVARLKDRISGVAAAMCLTNAVEPVRMRIARANCYRAALSSGQQQVDRLTIAQNELQSDARSGH
jgi:UrcA family protein